ncbi:MAG: topoisomerase C-terminal repeat-containing protein, partial [Methylocella sp.]
GYDFTAALEEKLDLVSNHELDWKQVLRDFWVDFSAALAGIKDLRTTEVLDSLNELLGPHIFPAKEDGSNPRGCPSCGTGQLSLKLGKFGAFIGCSHYPDCKFTRTLADTSADAAANGERAGAGILGQDSASGEEITLRDGRFGAYVQQGEGEKPKRVSLPKNIDSRELTMDQALGLLSLPREIARHPETKDPILAGIGRFGPYVQHGKTYASLGKDDDILSIGENRAIDLIVAKESGLTGRRFGDAASAPARVLGEHPAGGEVVVKAGRYGPYVNHGKINATLPRDADATRLTLDDAIALIAAKAAGKGGNAGMQGRLLGAHPTGGPVTVRAGRFGPYVNRGNTNATLKGGMSPETITLEEAIRLIEDKQEAGTRSRAKKIMRAAPKTTAKAAAARKLATKPPPQKAKKVKRA